MNASDFSTMYHVNPVVSNLNKVPGFDPLKYVRETKDGLKLDLPYKKLWFRLKYPNGIIRPLLLKMTDQLAIIEARVFFDRRDSSPAASFIAQCNKEEIERGDYIKVAQNSAIDQALSDAGFGVQFVPAAPGNTTEADAAERKAVEPSIAPIVQEEQTVYQSQSVAETKDAEAPLAKPEEKAAELTQSTRGVTTETVQEEEIPSAANLPQNNPSHGASKVDYEEITHEEPTPENAPVLSYTEDMTVEQILSVMSPDEAEKYVVKEGTCSGWTMAQVAERRPASLKFYMNGYAGKDNILRAAATIISQKTAA